MALSPVGRQANEGLLARLWRRIAGSSQDGPVWYQLEGGPGTEVLDVGAEPGTDVYSPVDGTVVSISDFVIDGKAYGSRIDVRPSAAPSLIVTLSHLEPDPSLAVGSPVLASSSKLGIVVDVAAVERQALAKHARARGNNVAIDVHPAAGSLRLNILFVGDVVGRPGREALEDRLAVAAGRARRRRSASSTARTSPTASASRRSSPSACSPPAPTRSRSATTPGGGRRSGPTSPRRTA